MTELRRALTYVEIDVDYCALRYGEAPCAAVLGETGPRKCFNTFKTCQDKINFSNVPKTIRFSVPTDYLPGDIDSFPFINSISYNSQTIDPGKSLGQRASVTVSLDDGQDSDSYIDKYLAERPYDPFRQGTFFGKFRARLPYIKGRPLRLIQGYLGQRLEDMDIRHFIIESTSGPGANAKFQFIAKDILKIADGDRAQAPRKSNGELSAGISESDTEIILQPAGIGDLEYPESGYASIGEECVAFTRVGDVVTIERSQFRTEAEEHDEDDLFQVMLIIEGESPALIIQSLLVDYADCPPDYIPIDEWQQEIASYINRVYSCRIATPTDVNKLVDELIEQVGLVMWWDEVAAQIKLRSLRPVVATADTITDDVIIQGSLRIREQPNKRVSQVWTSFNQLNPLESLERQSNYASGHVTIDAQSEKDHGVPAIHKVWSRWIGRFNRTAAQRLNAQILSRYRDPPRQLTFSVDRKQNTLSLGRGFKIESWPLQDDTGAVEPLYAIVTSIEPAFDSYKVEAEEMLFASQEDLSAQRVVVIDQSSTDINLRNVHDSIYTLPVDDEDILFIIEAGAIVGSSSALMPALDVGDWPPGVTLRLVIQGRVQGAGGRGGGYNIPAQAGGWALYARRAITVENHGGIWAGGGGGGAAYINGSYGSAYTGGGGGAGYLGGPGGVSNFAGSPDFDGTGAEAISPAVNGSPTAGGAGGVANYPGYFTNIGGAGGGPNQAGTTGRSGNYGSGGSGDITTHPGAGPGGAVDGDSFITYDVLGTILGARIN